MHVIICCENYGKIVYGEFWISIKWNKYIQCICNANEHKGKKKLQQLQEQTVSYGNMAGAQLQGNQM